MQRHLAWHSHLVLSVYLNGEPLEGAGACVRGWDQELGGWMKLRGNYWEGGKITTTGMLVCVGWRYAWDACSRERKGERDDKIESESKRRNGRVGKKKKVEQGNGRKRETNKWEEVEGMSGGRKQKRGKEEECQWNECVRGGTMKSWGEWMESRENSVDKRKQKRREECVEWDGGKTQTKKYKNKRMSDKI